MSRILPKPHTTGAVISDCGRFRERLWRIWSDRPRLMFVGLNPSTAGPEVNDNTVDWLMGWALANGFGGLEIANAYTFRTAYPAELRAARYPTSCGSLAMLVALAKVIDAEGGRVATGWGTKIQPNHESDLVVDLEIAGVLLYRWGVNKGGSPKHPLYLSQSVQLERWSRYA